MGSGVGVGLGFGVGAGSGVGSGAGVGVGAADGTGLGEGIADGEGFGVSVMGLSLPQAQRRATGSRLVSNGRVFLMSSPAEMSRSIRRQDLHLALFREADTCRQEAGPSGQPRQFDLGLLAVEVGPPHPKTGGHAIGPAPPHEIELAARQEAQACMASGVGSGFGSGWGDLAGPQETARSVISSPRSMIAKASSSCCSSMISGGLVKKVFQRTNV